MEEEEEVIVVEAVADLEEAEEEGGTTTPIQANPEATRSPEQGRLWLIMCIRLDQQSKRVIIQ